jgi:hypothetical protein
VEHLSSVTHLPGNLRVIDDVVTNMVVEDDHVQARVEAALSAGGFQATEVATT